MQKNLKKKNGKKKMKAAGNRILLCALAVLFGSLCGCTADGNNDSPLFCRAVGFDRAEGGRVRVTAWYETGYEKGSAASAGASRADAAAEDEAGDEAGLLLCDTAEDAAAAAAFLLSQNAVYKPVRALIFGKSLDGNGRREVMTTLLNNGAFQLKCGVYETDDAARALRKGNEAGADVADADMANADAADADVSFLGSFAAYYRIVTGAPEESKESEKSKESEGREKKAETAESMEPKEEKRR